MHTATACNIPIVYHDCMLLARDTWPRVTRVGVTMPRPHPSWHVSAAMSPCAAQPIFVPGHTSPFPIVSTSTASYYNQGYPWDLQTEIVPQSSEHIKYSPNRRWYMLCGVSQVSTTSYMNSGHHSYHQAGVCSNIAEMDAMQWMMIRNVPMPIYVSAVVRTQLCRGIQSIPADGICIQHVSRRGGGGARKS